MIIHSPIISGSLGFAEGATFTLPDNGIYSGSFSGSIAVHEVKSHLVPDTNVTYDLGSATNRFRDLYLSNNTIDFPSGSFGFGGNGFGFNDPNGDPTAIVAAEVKVIDSADGSFAKLSVVDGTLTTTAFDPFGTESAFDMKSQLSGSFTGSFLGEMLATNGVVSGSSQIVIGSVSGFSTFSSSVDTQILTEKGRIDAILASSDADKDSFAEIVTLINSVDTTNDNAFASFYTASNDRFDNIEGFTASIDSTIKTKLDADSVVSGSSQLLSLLPSGVVSSSAQVDADSITNFDSNVKTKLDVDSVVSSSVQVDVLQTTNFNTFSSSIADTFSGLSSNYVDLVGIPSGIISSSEQLAADFLDTLGDNVVSSSAQVDLTQTTNYASGIKLKLDAENVFSSSAQVDVTATTNYSTVSSHIASTSNPHSVTATQVGLGNVDNTSDAAKPVSTATQTALDLKATVVDLTAHEGDTDNPHSVTKAQVGLSNVDNESKATMFSSPTFTGTVSGVTKSQVGLSNVDNTSDANKPVSTATQTALNLKADVSSLNVEKGRIDAILTGSSADKDSFAEIVTLINSVDTTNDSAFAGFVTSSNAAQAAQDGRLDALESDSSLSTHEARTDNPHSVTKAQVGLGNVTNESKSTMFSSPTFTGTVSGVTKTHVGLGSVDNTSDAAKPVSTAQQTALNLKATVVDLTAHEGRTDNPHSVTNAQVGLGNVDNTSDANKPVSTATQTALNLKAADSDLTAHVGDTDNPHSVTKTQVGLGNVDNTSDANKPVSTATQTSLNAKLDINGDGVISGSSQVIIGETNGFNAFSSSVSDTFDGLSSNYVDLIGIPDGIISGSDQIAISSANISDVAAFSQSGTYASLRAQGTTKGDVGLGSVDNTADTAKPVSTAQQTALNLKANLASPTFTGTVSGVTKAHVGLGSVDNTSDAAKPVSTAQQTALNLKAPIASPTFTGTVGGVTKTHVGLGNVDNTSDAAKPVSTDTQTALNLKANLASPTFTGTVSGVTKTHVGLGSVDNTADTAKPVSTAQQTALNLKANLASPTFTGTVIAPTPTDNDDSTKVATTAFVMREVSDLLGGAPAAFDTLLEISASIANGDSDVVALTTVVGGKLQKDQNLSDLTSVVDAKTNLGLENVTNESKATMFSSPTFTGTVSGVTKAHVGLGSVDNTSDAAKPVSTDTQTALNLKANLASPTFTGTVGGVTKAHVGLGSVENTKLSTYTGNGGALDNQYITNGAGYTTNVGDITGVTAGNGLTGGGTTGTVTLNVVGENGISVAANAVSLSGAYTGTWAVTGGITATADVIAYSSSDSRLKDNVKNIENPIQKVQSLNGVTWDWNDNADELQKSIPNVGVIAQEVEQVLPQLVKDRENGYKGVDYAKLTGLLIEAIKEQQVQIDELKSKLG